ncbi:MAG: ThuA domain-containing protein [Planctomycetaceae bacterium]|nr:ThuA domain-containing protein [Planctomycetaceae bacterium]
MRKSMLPWVSVGICLLFGGIGRAEDLWVEYPGGDGPAAGRRIVLVSGDEEYRSEEALPQLARILSVRHGFRCTVLFAIDPATGEINPDVNDNIPGLGALGNADLMIIATRFRNLPDEQMEHIVRYVESGKPIIGMRTATHAFNIPEDRKYARYGWQSKEWNGGFGRQLLGETWISHHGKHKEQSTRGIIAPGAEEHPIVRGCDDIWGPTDVYGVRLPQPENARPLILGQVLSGMQPTDSPVEGSQNDPLMPVAWTMQFTSEDGTDVRNFMTTMGAATDLESEGVRRLLVNAAYWCLGIESQIAERADVRLVGEYHPSAYGFKGFVRGVKPAEYKLAPPNE